MKNIFWSLSPPEPHLDEKAGLIAPSKNEELGGIILFINNVKFY